MTAQSMKSVGYPTTKPLTLLGLAAALIGAACHHVTGSKGSVDSGAQTSALTLCATYVDSNDNGVCDANDELVLQFDPARRAPTVDSTFMDRVTMPVNRSYLGQDPTARVGSHAHEVIISLGVFPNLKTRQIGSIANTALNAPAFLEYQDQDGAPISSVDIVPGFGQELLSVSTNADAVASGDFNRDGVVDLAIADGVQLYVALGDGKGGFAAVLGATDPEQQPIHCLAVADLERHGRLSVIAGTEAGFKVWRVVPFGDSVQIELPDEVYGQEPVLDLVVVDLDTDGILDVATAVDGSDAIWKGVGAFGLFDWVTQGAPGITHDILATDYDGDGDVDLLKAHEDSLTSGVLVLAGDGAGGLTPVETLLSGLPVRSLAFGPLDGDALPELVAGLAPGSDLEPVPMRVLTSDAGTFSVASDLGSDVGLSRPRALELIDVDGDNALDLVVTDESGTQLFVNDGTGELMEAGITYVMPDAGVPIAFDDDRDGDRDLLVPTAEGLYRLSASLAGTWGYVSYEVDANQTVGSESTFALVSGDFDEDGLMDFATGNNQSIEIFLAQAAGVFGTPDVLTLPNARVRDLIAADLDGDGHLDLACALQGPATGGFAGLSIRLGDGTGSFVNEVSVLSSTPQCSALAAGDLDRDGDLDIFLAGMNGLADQLVWNRGRDATGWLGMQTPERFAYANGLDVHTSDVALADIDRNGTLDIVSAHAPGNPSGIWYGDGEGNFGFFALPGSIDSDTRSIAVADINLDGQPDIVAGNTETDSLWLQDSGNFPQTPLLSDSDTYEVQLVEVNGDAYVDLLVANRGVAHEEGLQVWFNAGTTVPVSAGTSGAWLGFGDGGLPNQVLRQGLIESVLAADLDHDGDIDFISGSTSLEIPNALWRSR